MARNKDNKKGFDPAALMAGMEETAEEVKEVGSSPPPQITATPKATEKPQTKPAAKPEAVKKVEYKKRSFYITDEQYDAIKLIAATSKDPLEKDQSQIVRTAIDQYIKNRKK